MTYRSDARLSALEQSLLRLRLQADRVIGRVGGVSRSRQRGVGTEFHDLRPYVDGDDIRAIDWRVTARAGQPFIRRFEEDRDRRLLLLVDASGSMAFGSVRPHGPIRTKWIAALEVAVVLGLVAARERARTAWRTPLASSPPQRGTQSVREAFATLSRLEAAGPDDFDELVRQVARDRLDRSLCVLLTDRFFVPDRETTLALGQIARRHDAVAVAVSDPAEFDLPDLGLVRLLDPETGRRRVFDSSSRPQRQRYRDAAAARSTTMRGRYQRIGIRLIEASTSDEPAVTAAPLLGGR